MVGTKITKPVTDWEQYAIAAEWCNGNNAYIVEHDDCYEVVAIPEPSFEEIKEQKLSELSAAFTAVVGGSTFIGTADHTYLMQFDRADALAVQGMIQLMEATGQTVGYLTQADDTTVYDVGLDDIKVVLVGMLKAYASAHAQKQIYRAKIDNARSVEDLNAIVFKWEVLGTND